MRVADIRSAILFWGILSEEAVIYLKEKAQEGFVLINPELRPYLLGLRWNRDVLQAAGLRFLYCTDNMLGHLFYRRKVKEVLILYQEKAERGYVCLSGSLYVYELAKYHKVKIKFISGTELNLDKFSDRDASTLGGRLLYGENSRKIEVPQGEIIREEEDG